RDCSAQRHKQPRARQIPVMTRIAYALRLPTRCSKTGQPNIQDCFVANAPPNDGVMSLAQYPKGIDPNKNGRLAPPVLHS
ncbi:MAG: hypothetical protein ACTHNN_17970, partial [Xanthobacteraceae bacterium]